MTGQTLAYLQAAPLPAMAEVGGTRQTRVLAAVLTCGLVAGILLLTFAPWQQSISGTGRVIAYTPNERQQTIDAPVEGRVIRWDVAEGSTVKPGDVIAEIADNDPDILQRLAQEKDAVRVRLQAARERAQFLSDRLIRLDESRQNGLAGAASRFSMARERVRSAEQALLAAEARQLTARRNIERTQALETKGLASTRTLELVQLEASQAAAEVDRAKAGLNAAAQEQEALGADRSKVETDFRGSMEDAKATRAAALVEIANAQAEVQRMDVRLARQHTQLVRAPRRGTVLRLIAQPGGDVLKAGDPIALFVPETTTNVVELYVNGNDVPLITEGRHVRLQFEGWPAIQFTGWPSVAVGTFGGNVLLVDATDNGQGKFRLLVGPDPNDQPWPDRRYLRQGVRANGWVLLNTVKLGFELWRQFNGFPPALAQQDAETGKGAKK